MPGLTVLPPPQTPGDLVIRVANDPIWPVPRKEGSAAWEKANLHKALGLATALQGTGARVVYYGTADSSVAAYAPGVAVETVPLIEGGIAEHPEWDARSREDAYYGAFYEAVAREGAHAAIVGGDEQSFREVPALALALPSTRFFCHNHGLGPSPDKPRAYERCNGVVHFVAISHAQVREYPTIQHAGVVYNALHPDEFRLQPEPVDCQINHDSKPLRLPAGYALFVARMNREKGPDLAVTIAREAGLRLVLAGPLAPREWDPNYFRDEVAGSIDGDHVVYLGELGPDDLDRVYRGAACLLNPIRWEEPFGFTVVEAMARGVPVIATPRGAMPELVEDGLTGYLAGDVAQSAQRAHDAITRIDRAACAARAHERYSWGATGRAYLDLVWHAFHGHPVSDAG
ncbi:MAG TPA: glycosyltransferase [Ktedonobacterales bacterium]|jgi:glycosyltransferase involved in cell wall biosynthesis